MLNLNGIVSVETIREVQNYTDLRFKDSSVYKCAEALVLYEQRLLPNEEIFALCEKTEGEDLYIPATSYIPEEIIRHFRTSDIIPISYSPMRHVLTCIALKEIGTNYTPYKDITVDVYFTPIYNYFQEYIKKYGPHPSLLDIPAKQLLDSIVNEAIELSAADITISSNENSATVYYNVRKRKVYSQRILTSNNIADIIKIMCIESPIDYTTRKPKYVGITLNDYYRGRVVINHKYKGFAITTRLLPNAAFNKTLEDCNLSNETIRFIRQKFMNRELGLRIVAGSTASGKNTTILAALKEIVEDDKYKVVSIEMPVEQILEGVEQINCDTEEEYEDNINSLIRQNPDIVYVTETGDNTAESVLRTANTGKILLTTIHANSCADVIGRLVDLTGMSTDKIVQVIHSIVYQELVRDEEKDEVYPRNKYVYFSRERKKELYGKSYGEVIMKVDQWEGGDVW